VSLLLDALKRAEQEKMAKQGDRSANDAPAHAPSPAAAPKREPANAPALELQPLGSAANAAHAAPAKQSGAATAHAVFQAKAAPAQAKAEGERTKTVLIIAGGVILLAILAIGGYFWWQLNSMPQQITTLARRAPASGTVTTPSKVDTLVPGAIAPVTQRSDSTPPASSTSSAPSVPPASSGTTTTTSTTASAPSSSAPAPSTSTARIEEAAPPARTSAESVARLVREAPSGPSLRLAPAPAPRVPAEIVAGYEALRSGDLQGARRSYTAAYAADSSSIDANLGLATVEARLGNIGAAAGHYRRVLDADPGNATALAGLASMADMSQPEQLEQQLRADIARYPQSAALHFALGNLYAARGRWQDAQAAFFETLRLEPASADALYNLAVAMDHMGQSRLAADYYGRAVSAARGRNASFDRAQVERRIAELRP
jgi:tetratricopeptide (TPR) repeat protein